ncbi:MAG TPA: class I SAM-dependent methyltransferase [Rhodanobacter sp.]|jgi:2-polyprenyl-3-methyl-5-hydroxy-6-metoxy-1,4-benzoquinol methylase
MPEIIEDKASQSTPAWQEPWPADELEQLSACPVCGSTVRELQQRDLVDNAFFVAPGRWTLYRCSRCRSAYLDPRPNEASIGKAYGVYYTHSVGESRTTSGKPGIVNRLKQALNNGYANSRYGTRRQPASRLGVWLARVLPLRRQRRDAEFRYLPKPRSGQRLLDIGCGNGDFLINARDAGWDVAGVDPDPRAVAAARQRGLEVGTGSIELFADVSNCFDAITLSHVLEHLHDPVSFIRAVHRLLKADGVLFVDTPNIDSRGARRWGRNWRGLETPRHLVLFSRTGLIGMLQAGGFGSIETKRRTAVRKSMDLASLRMQLGKSPDGDQPRRLPAMMRIRQAWPVGGVRDDEFLTLIARKVSD